MKRTHGQSPHVLPSGSTRGAVRRIRSRTRARCVGCRLDDEPRGSSEGGKRNRHLFDLLIAGNDTDGSTPLRTAPAGERRVVLGPGVEGVADIADGYAPYSRGADENPLVCGAPIDEQPASVG